MSNSFSNADERFIENALASGRFASREAVISAGLLELRAAEGDEEARLLLCDHAMKSIEQGRGIEATDGYWEGLRRRIQEGLQSQFGTS